LSSAFTSMSKKSTLHLGLDLLVESLELVHICCLGRPANAQPLLLVGLGDLNISLVYNLTAISKLRSNHLSYEYNIPCGSEPKQTHQHYTISKWAIQTYMVNNLVRNPAIVLQDIEISRTTSLGNLLCNGLYKIRSAIYSPASSVSSQGPWGSSKTPVM
jgi:hypothetical protein